MDLVVTHINADLDAVASMVALGSLHGPVTLALPGGVDPTASRFLRDHGAELPPLLAGRALLHRLDREPLERLLVADTANVERLGVVGRYVSRFARVQAWDNHPAADGDLPRAEPIPSGACVSTLVLQLAQAGGRPSFAEAGLFLVGIHQDTGHFSYVSTTELDHRAAAQCCRWGAPMDWPARYVPRGFTRAELGLLEQMARDVELLREGEHVLALIALELDSYQPNLAVLLEQLREAEQWPSAVLVASVGARTFCIARCRGGLDAGEILRALGGGGHTEAASAVLRGMTFANARKLVRSTIIGFLGQQLTAGRVASQPVISLPTATPIARIGDELHRRRINAIPLTRPAEPATAEAESADSADRATFVGIVTRQEVDAAVRHGLGQRPASEIVSRKPVWVKPQTPLREVRKSLFVGGRRLVLVGTPPSDAIGVLTRGRLLQAYEPSSAPATLKRQPPPRVVMTMAARQLAHRWPLLTALADLGNRCGNPVYLVGGSVRDVLLGVPVRDVDVLVEGDAPRLAQRAAAEIGGEAVVREGFCTARWHPGSSSGQGHDEPIDLASSRSEYYAAPAALPEVAHASIEQDLYRRDFTINAMALGLSGAEAGHIIDPHGGLFDLQDGVLRVLHGLSFHDDPTRAWRAARFAARLDFRVASDTLGLLRAARRTGAMDRLTLGRLGAELERLLDEPEVVQAFRLLRQWKLNAVIHPELDTQRPFLGRLDIGRSARFRILELVTDVASETPRQSDVLWIVLAGSVPAADRSDRLALVGGGKRRRQRWLHGPERVAKAIAGLQRAAGQRPRIGRTLEGLDAVELIATFGACASDSDREAVLWWLRQGRSIRSAVSGHTLLELGYPEGPGIKQALEAALDCARDGGDAATQLRSARATLVDSSCHPK